MSFKYEKNLKLLIWLMLVVLLMLTIGCVQTSDYSPPPVIPMQMEAVENQLYLEIGQERIPVKNETGYLMIDYLVRLKEWRINVYGY